MRRAVRTAVAALRLYAPAAVSDPTERRQSVAENRMARAGPVFVCSATLTERPQAAEPGSAQDCGKRPERTTLAQDESLVGCAAGIGASHVTVSAASAAGNGNSISVITMMTALSNRDSEGVMPGSFCVRISITSAGGGNENGICGRRASRPAQIALTASRVAASAPARWKAVRPNLTAGSRGAGLPVPPDVVIITKRPAS